MTLRKECPHGHYENHFLGHSSVDFRTGWCPGGDFLTDDALVIEKINGEWPEWVSDIYNQTRPASNRWDDTDPALDFLNALANRQS